MKMGCSGLGLAPGELQEYIVHRPGVISLFQFLRSIQRFNTTIHHNGNTIAVFGFIHVVCRHENGYALIGSAIDHFPELTAGDRIDASRWFIEKDQAWFVDGNGLWPRRFEDSLAMFRRVAVGVGDRSADMVYFPASVACGLFVSLLAVAALCAVAVGRGVRR